MIPCLIRPPYQRDIDSIAQLWHTAFGDPPARIMELFANEEILKNTLLAETDGGVRSFMLSFPGLSLSGRPCAYLYGLCTQPEYRGMGLASAVLRALAKQCFSMGAEFVCLYPASDGLQQWYQSEFSMKPVFSYADLPLTPATAAAVPCRQISHHRYAALRHSAWQLTPALLWAQALLMQDENCTFFLLDLPDAPGLACARKDGNALLVLELLCSETSRAAALETLQSYFPTVQIFMRTADQKGSTLLALTRPDITTAIPTNFCFPFVMA